MAYNQPYTISTEYTPIYFLPDIIMIFMGEDYLKSSYYKGAIVYFEKM